MKNIKLFSSLILLTLSLTNANSIGRRKSKPYNIEAKNKKNLNYLKARRGGKGIIFNRKTDLSGFRGPGKNLIQIQIPEAKLNGVNISKSDLTNSNLSLSDMRNCIGKRAVLIDANLSGTCISGSNFSYSKLTNTNMSGNIGFWKKLWKKITFSYDPHFIKNKVNINLRNLALINCNLQDNVMINVDFRRSSLDQSKFNRSIIINGDFRHVTSLNKTNFSGVTFYNPNFIGTSFEGSIVKKASIYINGGTTISTAQIIYLLNNGANIYIDNKEISLNDYTNYDYNQYDQKNDFHDDYYEDDQEELDQDYDPKDNPDDEEDDDYEDDELEDELNWLLKNQE